MINGERGVVLPGPVWFEREYDLGLKFPEHSQVQHAMLLVSKACTINPDKRPTLSDLIEMFRELDQPYADVAGKIVSIEMLRAEAYIKVEYQQRRAATATFVRAIHLDLLKAITNLYFSNPDLQIWCEWYRVAISTSQTVGALEQQVADQESDAPVVNVFFRRRILTTRFYPAAEKMPASFNASLAGANLTIRNEAAGPLFEMQLNAANTTSGQYKPGLLQQFLEEATRSALVS